MPSIEHTRRQRPAVKELLRQELSLASVIALGAAALIQMARGSGPDPKDVAAYNTLRASELETDAYAKVLQKQGPESRAAANAVDKLGQELSGLRGELEDKLDAAGYFDKET